ncbi:MAG: ABC transporter ATP-binding protein [Thermomicrobiales bacterium]
MSDLVFDRVRKRFDQEGRWVVDDFSLRIESGELVTLLGPSGCGKTTVLRMIAGLETPSGGDILIDGQSIVSLKPGDRNIALVFQQYALYPDMTVAENLEYPLKSLRMPKEQRKQLVDASAEWLELTSLLNRMPRELSGGEQQRVAVGRALIRKPRVSLLDEPLANLDAQLRLRTRAEIRRRQRETGITTVVVTHDQNEAMAISDRIAVMHQGRIAQVGTPDDLYQRPANVTVAGFVGSPPMNLLSAQPAEDSLIIEETGRIPAPPASIGNRVRKVGVRPEDLKIVPTGAEGLVMRVTNTEPHGHETLIRAGFGASVVWIRARSDQRPGSGAVVTVSVNPATLHYFAEDGTRVEAGMRGA